MKKYYLLLVLIISLGLSSCLESGLDDLPVFEDADITNFNFEVRWKDATTGDFKVYGLQNTPTIDKDNKTVINKITVPTANANFPEEVRNAVSVGNIVGYCDLSTAATIEPVEGAPKLGVPGNFSSSVKYKVTAADKQTEKIWTVNTTIVSQ